MSLTKAQVQKLAMLESRVNTITGLINGILSDIAELEESGLDIGLVDHLNERCNQLRSAKSALMQRVNTIKGE